MNKEDILTLYTYNQWANRKIMGTTANVRPEQFLAGAAFPHGGLRSTLTHAMFAEWIWRSRWQGTSPSVRFKPDDFPTFESLRLRWSEEDKRLMEFVDSVTDEQLNSVVGYKDTKGLPHQQILWKMMLHVVNHGTQHRTEAAAMLTEYGCSPGDLDMIYVFNE